MNHTGIKAPKGKPWKGCMLCESFGVPSVVTVYGVRLCQRHLDRLQAMARENGIELEEVAA